LSSGTGIPPLDFRYMMIMYATAYYVLISNIYTMTKAQTPKKELNLKISEALKSIKKQFGEESVMLM